MTIVAFCGALMTPPGNRVVRAAAEPMLYYSVHAQSFGWMNPVSNGATAGTVGQSKRLEAFAIQISTGNAKSKDGKKLTGGVVYRAHMQNLGWINPVAQKADKSSIRRDINSGNYAGVTGRSLRMEAFTVFLTGKLAQEYDIIYRAHVQGIGWQPWFKNGNIAGTVGQGRRVEAMEIKLVKKLSGKESALLSGDSHVQNIGWKSDGQITFGAGNSLMLGTTGRGLRMEAMRLSVKSNRIKGSIAVQAHVQNVGWQSAVGSGGIAGSEGQSLRIEAVRLSLTGALSDHYDIWYRAHVQNFGWLGWTFNGNPSGTEGMARRMEALEIRLVPKAEPAPGSTDRAFIKGVIDDWHLLPGELYLKVNKQQNVVTAYKGNVAIRAMICSTGEATPLGTFYTPAKFRWGGLMGPSYGQYMTQVVGGYLLHSIPYLKEDPMTMTPEYNKLGTTCSHGCIRLRLIDAKWIYDNCPLKTRVVIYESPDPGPLGKPVLEKIPENQTWDPTDPSVQH